MEQLAGEGLLYYSTIFLFGLSAFILSLNLISDEEKFKTGEKFDEAENEGQIERKKNHGFILTYSRPFFKRYLGPIVAGLKGRNKIRKKYRQKLANAGLLQDMNSEDFYAFKLFLIFGFPIVFLGVREFGEFYDWPLALTPIVSLFGFFYPDIWIDGKIVARKEEIIRAMPFIVDLLALCVEAGLDFVAAMGRVVEKAPPSALSEEFETLMKEIKIGSSRTEALRNMSWRINTLEIASFCSTLIAADSVGASIGPILKTLSIEIRQKKSALVEKKGAQAATKILFPILVFIMPAVFIAIGTPMIIQFLEGNK